MNKFNLKILKKIGKLYKFKVGDLIVGRIHNNPYPEYYITSRYSIMRVTRVYERSLCLHPKQSRNDTNHQKFDELESYVDLEETFNLVGKKNPKVLEIGCGNGRDAREIIKRTKK